jgi:hypothetical protein
MKLTLTIAALLCFAGIGMATPVCGVGLVSSYESLGPGGCLIGGINFYNFIWSDIAFSGDVQPHDGLKDTQANIVPLIDANGVGFEIVPLVPWVANNGGVTDADLSYQASAGSAIITGLYLAVTGSAGHGSFVDAQERFCEPGTPLPPDCTGTSTPQIDDLITSGTNVTAIKNRVFSAAVSSFSASKDIALDARAFHSDPASVTSVINQLTIDQGTPRTGVPEPWTLALVGGGLLGIGLLRRRV